MTSDYSVCSPCGLEVASADRTGELVSLMQREDEPLVLITHLLRWCRDEHRVLWEAQKHAATASWGLSDARDHWPTPGTQTRVSRELRDAMTQLLESAGGKPAVVTARTLALLLDEHFWPSFRDSFERRSPYQPGVGDPVPLDGPDVRGLTDMTPTSPPWRLANRLDQTRHIRLAGEWAAQFRVVFDYSASRALAGLVSPETIVATCHPNQDLSELILGDTRSARLFPVAPRDPDRQAKVIDGLIKTACDAGAQIVVLPELSTTGPIARDLEAWVRRDDGPRLLVAGSHHHREDGRRTNTAVTWLRGHTQPLVHDKHSPGDRPRPEGIEPQGWPELNVYVGADGFHLVVAVCRDLLNPSAVHALTEVGANLVLVPAMSETLMPFVGAVANLVTSCQALVAVSNNPADWSLGDTRPASRPARALLGHPGLGLLTRLVQPSDPTPGIALMRVSSGQVTWVPTAAGPAGLRFRDTSRPAWAQDLARTACIPDHDVRRSTAVPGRRAAVLALLSERGGELSVLLTTRASDLSRYPGLISFPGGLADECDGSVIETALREAEEEVGVAPESVDVLGVMSPMALPADGLTVYPVLARKRETPAAGWSRNYSEVDALDEIPLRILADRPQGEDAPGLPAGEARLANPSAQLGDMTRAIVDRLLGGALRAGLLRTHPEELAAQASG